MLRDSERTSIRSFIFVGLALALIYIVIYVANYEKEVYLGGEKRDYEFLETVLNCQLPSSMIIMKSAWFDRSEIHWACYEIEAPYLDFAQVLEKSHAQLSKKKIFTGESSAFESNFGVDTLAFDKRYVIQDDEDVSAIMIIDDRTSPTLTIYLKAGNYQYLRSR